MKTAAFPLLALLALAAFSLRNEASLFSKKTASASGGWDADAGVIRSFTENAAVTASSNAAQAAKALDGDPATAWQSEAPLPEGFLRRADLNVFLKRKNFPPAAVDGDLATAEKMPEAGGFAADEFALETPQALFSISLKCQVAQELRLDAVSADGKLASIGKYLPADNFTLKRFELPPGLVVKKIALLSKKGFELFELAALADLPKEWLVFDFGAPRPVGVIHTKHWAGENAVLKTKLFLSTDAWNWTLADSLEPSAVQPVVANVSRETIARYLKVEHTLLPHDWNKVFLWEVKAYDRHGHFGERPPAQPGSVTLREMLGVNGYWSWGTDKCSDEHSAQEPPQLLRPVASHARNYHDLTWDLTSPSDKIDFEKMASGGGTPAKSWLDWNREYRAWLDAGLNVQASIQIYKFQPSDWKNPFQEARDYAFAFIRHFGATHGSGLVCTIEAGNEPWKYDAPTYRQILLGMAKGAAAGDPTVEVFPCALQAADPAAEQSGVFKNYIGARVTPEAAEWLDGINLHTYSYSSNRTGNRRAVQPEHPNSTFWEILNAIRWRNRKMPGKKIYLSEWGWDSAGAGEDCTHDECVSEQAGAFYAVRGALIAARLGMDRATWFYHANDKSSSSLYTRSGLTGSASTGFQKKKAFLALESLVKLAGGRYFLDVVREDETAWMYLLGSADGKPTHLVAWLPVEGDSGKRLALTWETRLEAASAVRLDGSSAEGVEAKKPATGKDGMRLELTPAPLLVRLR